MAGFNTTGFMKQDFEQRTKVVQVPALKNWFDEGSPAEWKIRGLTGHEVAKGREIEMRGKNMGAVIEAIGNTKEQVGAIKNLVGLTEDTPVDLLKRLEQLCVASIEPKVDKMLAVRLAEKFPGEFYILTNEIANLTAMGMDVKKPKASGEIKK